MKKPGKRTSRKAPPRPPLRPAVVTCLLIAILIVASVWQLQPPAAAPADAPAAEFSSARALEQLRTIAQRPHPAGSADAERVRLAVVRQLLALGLQPLVQVTTAVRSNSSGPTAGGTASAATVENIVAKLPGTRSRQAVLLVAHYDSVPSGPGASDDGSGVVTLLETARALKAGPRLTNDVIFLFTDAEESGLLGARAFVDEHAWARQVGVVLNFEARGACGPSLMFETSAGNGWLIREWAKAAPHPVASSLMYDAYRRLPLHTDLDIFKPAGFAGLNFAYVGCVARYHTAGDSVANLDERSLQHDGSYALALARRFANEDLSRTRAPDLVYFSLFGFVIRYPQVMVLPLAMLALLAFIAVAGFGLRRKQLTARGMALGFGGWLAAAAAAAGVSQLLWMAVRNTRFAPLLPYGAAYNGDLYVWAFVALTVAVVAAFIVWTNRRAGIADLTMGVLGWWLILALASAFAAPGGSGLFVWPLLASLLEVGYAFTRRDPQAEEESALFWTLPAIVGLLLFVPLLVLVVEFITNAGIVVITLAAALLAGYLAPQIHLLVRRRPWWLSDAAGAVGVVLLVAGMATGGFDAHHPGADSLFYALDADSGRAVWATLDRAPDAWTSRVLTGTLEHADAGQFVPGPHPLLEAPAQALPLLPPDVVATDDLTVGDQRNLRLRITSPRRARVLWVTVEGATVQEAQVNGKRIQSGAGSHWAMVYSGVPQQGILLTLGFPASQNPVVKVTDQSDGLPALAGAPPRPPDRMPDPSWPRLDNSTVVVKTFRQFPMMPMAH